MVNAGMAPVFQAGLRSACALPLVILFALWARKRLSHLTPQVAAAGMLTASTLIAVPVAWLIEGPISLDLSLRTWTAIAYYSLIATAFAFLLFYQVLKIAGMANTALVTLLVAPVAIVLGAIVLGEELPLRAYAGFAILAAGLMILNGGRRR